MKKLDVQKFGGVTHEHGKTKLNGSSHEVFTTDAKSDTTLEKDIGVGNAVIVRCFTYGANKEAFLEHKPTLQELFNYHHKGIEIELWKDGLMVMPDVKPRVVFNEEKSQYQIFVGARPSRGQELRELPQTLSELVNG